MPLATIEVRRHYSRDEEIAMIDAVHTAMIEGLKILEWDKNIRLFVHEAHRFATPPGKSDRYTLVSIDLFAGRSLDAKRALYRAIIQKLAPFEIPADEIKIVLREIPRDNFGIRGGVPASEVELGFDINV